jgi:23S rRNA (adenine2503-C2)-methyltransferase
VVSRTGREDLAVVYIAETADGRAVEFVESLQPPRPREDKWVIILSTLFGCPVKCTMCDAGDHYRGRLTADQMFSQIDFLVDRRFPGRRVDVDKFKIQFARMGEPAFNPGVLSVLRKLPSRYDAPGLMPCLSTIAPSSCPDFFRKLLEIKKNLYPQCFQLQFSVHTTDRDLRDRMIPAKKWDFAEIAAYGDRFVNQGDRKVALNFALEKDAPIEAAILGRYFDPEKFIIKITPINPTYSAARSQCVSYLDPHNPLDFHGIADRLRAEGYQVIMSIGEAEENALGSNCGQLVTGHLREKQGLPQAYTQSHPLAV